MDLWTWLATNSAPVSTLAAIAAAFIAFGGVVFTVRDARSRAQPSVGFELRKAGSFTLELVMVNRGPTPARDIRVTFDPPIEATDATDDLAGYVKRRYTDKTIPFLAPGQEFLNVWETVEDRNQGNGRPSTTADITYKGLGWRRLKTQSLIHANLMEFETAVTSSTDSLKGRLKEIRDEIRKLNKGVGKPEGPSYAQLEKAERMLARYTADKAEPPAPTARPGGLRRSIGHILATLGGNGR